MNLYKRMLLFAHCPAGVLLIPGMLCAAVCFGQTDCTTPPPPDTTKNFLQNFLNPCYAVPLRNTVPIGSNLTDFDQTYSALFYRVNPGFELVLIGEFSQSRYMSITADDSHWSTAATIRDANIKPLVPGHVNPFTPGTQYKEDQLYSVRLQFGGTQPEVITPGCQFAALEFHGNILDASKRHAGISWNGKPDLPAGFPVHDDTGPNTGGLVTVRQYLSAPDLGVVHLVTPVVIVRDLSTGCAVPASKAYVSDAAAVTPDHLITFNQEVAVRWISTEQVRAHQTYRSLQKAACYSITPASAIWFRPDEYIEAPSPDAGYLVGVIPPAHVKWLVANKTFMRIRFRTPTMASLPCPGCTLNGSEQLRHLSLSFYDNRKRTLASIGEHKLVRDPNGYVTVIVGFGGLPPSHVTAENYYTYLDLSAVPGYENLIQLCLRTLIPSAAFQCSASAVPFKTTEDNSVGGLMGEYAPVVDVTWGEKIPRVAVPPDHPNSCGAVPPEAPRACEF